PHNEEIKRDVEGLGGDGWELKEDKIVKSFQFSSFMNAIEFVNNVAKIAEKVNHHPIIKINWRTVKLSLKSFDVTAITKRDINLAKEIENAITDHSDATRSE
ncbi:MAG TPA: 4a-hydroxytetrahydrobiopterin dehydratase, partial [Nitrososphaeraceae archaeon]|nr:4a-hydroxytetrahydrobiopterin dehydratase [Nitrososphaeraceae archaeon]